MFVTRKASVMWWTMKSPPGCVFARPIQYVGATSLRNWWLGLTRLYTQCPNFTPLQPPAVMSDFYWGSNVLLHCCTGTIIYTCYTLVLGTLGSVVGWGSMLQAERSRARFPMRSFDFSTNLIFPAALWPWGRPGSNRSKYQKSSWGSKGRPARKADNLTDIWEPII
jgi:hypothetical protein